MNTRTTLASYQARRNDLADQAHQLNTQEWELWDSIRELQQRVLKEENLLQVRTWKFRRTKSGFCLDSGRDEDWPELVDLIGDSPFDSSFNLPDGTVLHISHEGVWLSFGDAEVGLDFIKEYGLAVDASRLASEIRATKKALSALRALSEYLPVKEETQEQM